MFESVEKFKELIDHGSNLQEVFNKTTDNEMFPKIKWVFPEDKFKSYSLEDEEDKGHEAGYDAMITG